MGDPKWMGLTAWCDPYVAKPMHHNCHVDWCICPCHGDRSQEVLFP